MMYIAYSPYFRKIYKYPPISAKFINLVQFTFFGLIYIVSFPLLTYFDAFMHHALHVLDAHSHDHTNLSC